MANVIKVWAEELVAANNNKTTSQQTSRLYGRKSIF
jgi:hypothetical protein